MVKQFICGMTVCVLVAGCDAPQDTAPVTHTKNQDVTHEVTSVPPGQVAEQTDAGMVGDTGQDMQRQDAGSNVARAEVEGADDMGRLSEDGELPAQKPLRQRPRNPNVPEEYSVTCCDGPLQGALLSGTAKYDSLSDVVVEPTQKLSSRIEAGALNVTQGCDQEMIAKQIKKRLVAIQRCHERVLAKGTDETGSVTYTVVSDVNGRAESVSSSQDTVQNDEVSACGSNVLKRLRYGKSTESTGCVITQTLTFHVEDNGVSSHDAP